MPGVPEPRAYRDGIAVYGWTRPDRLPVAVNRGRAPQPHVRRHIHDFPVIALVGSGDDVDAAVDAWIIAPGAIVDPRAYFDAEIAIAVFFDPRAIGIDAGSWSAHPLLAVFRHRRPDGVLRLPLSAARSARWRAALEAVDDELTGRAPGYADAVAAHLTLLLIDLARLAPTDPEPDDEPTRAVLAEIDARYAEPLTLPALAAAAGLSPGHLSTLVRERTGRTPMAWLTERRMTAARRLLDETDRPIAEVARLAGYPDPAYFARVFRSRHGVAPLGWRRDARG